MLRHIVPDRSRSERLDRHLTLVLTEFSRARIQRLIAQGYVHCAGKKMVKASHRVSPGEEIQIELPPPTPSDLQPEKIPLRVIYEDDFLLLVDKPAGMVVHPAPGHPSGTLVNALLGRGIPLSSTAGPAKPGIVHRLDKDTSGILVVAKEDSTHRDLGRQFASRQVRRTYVAVVQGTLRHNEGTIDAPIGRHPIKRQQMTVRYGAGREAVTRYRVVERFQNATLLELFPQTGRTHQLRVHLVHLGHPILGDSRYGGARGFSRQALHAHRLGFLHPNHRRWVEFVSPLPKDLRQLIRRLKGSKNIT